MLLHLDLKDFVLVDRTTLDFASGFSTLTGETGAGKSILLDALLFLLGGKADVTLIKQGREKTDISATFGVTEAVSDWLSANELENGPELQLRRTLDLTGKNRCYINGTPSTATQLREVGELLIDIHGQHDQQRLLKPANQRALLDSYAQHNALLEEVKAAWHDLQKAQVALTHAQQAQALIDAQREQLAWEFEELDQIKPIAGEWEELEQEHKRLSHSAQLLETLQSSLDLLNDGENSVLDQLQHVHQSLSSLAKLDDRTATLAEPIDTALIQLQESIRNIRHYLNTADLDPERLATVEQRTALLHASARKLRVSAPELPSKYEAVQANLTQLAQQQDIAVLQQAVTDQQAKYMQLANALSDSRVASARRLSDAVTHDMQALALASGQFSVACQAAAPSQTGIDSIEFLVTANVGQPLRPMAKVASGGELARMSLALCVITSSQSNVACLIFDEVDSGIGGATADIVGQHLRQLGTQVQVLAVTHLAQVAANAHQQFKVSKYIAEGQTVSTVTALSESERTDEIARMLGGENITVTTRYHAQELLTSALHRHSLKNKT